MNLKPLQDRIIVQRIEEQEDKNSLIVLPDNAKEKSQLGKVLAVGRGRVLENGTDLKMALKEGDTILFGKYTGTEVEIDNEKYLVMREDDVFARVGG